jgi:hypothetical protein
MKIRRIIKQLNRLRGEWIAYWRHGKMPSFADKPIDRRLAYHAAEACAIQVRKIRRRKRDSVIAARRHLKV